MTVFLIILIAYLIGSIPFGLLGKFFFKIEDPRTFGSKNIGATNVLRSGNKKAAAFTLFFDMFKGFIAVFISSFIDNDFSEFSKQIDINIDEISIDLTDPTFKPLSGDTDDQTDFSTIVRLFF